MSSLSFLIHATPFVLVNNVMLEVLIYYYYYCTDIEWQSLESMMTKMKKKLFLKYCAMQIACYTFLFTVVKCFQFTHHNFTCNNNKKTNLKKKKNTLIFIRGVRRQQNVVVCVCMCSKQLPLIHFII